MTKKILFMMAVIYSINGFSQFGVKANYVSLDGKLSGDGESYTESFNGFGIGGDYTLEKSEFNLIFGFDVDFIKQDGDSVTILTPSAILSYPLSDKIGLRGGVSLVNWTSNDDDIDLSEINKSMLHLPIGVDINVSNNLSIIAQYSLPLGNRLKSDIYEDGVKFTDPSFKFGFRFGI